MSQTNWYLGFGASDALYSMNNIYRASLENGSEKEQAEKLLALLNQFADECLDQYFMNPIERVKLNSMGQKIVSGGVSAMKKTIHLTLKQVVKKMSKADRLHMADYINGLLKPLRESERYPTYVAVEISPELRERLGRVVANGKEQGADAIAKDYSDALCELVEVAIHSYMDKPLSMMKLGMVMNKITSVASDAIRSAAKTVIRKVIPSMSSKEMEGFFEFSESILYPHPA
ncbi:hypothetical protein [Ketobacter alkanivorans]|uniref:Uncharacterized protein n=1 Tax=Ketobacter alkanivorans TaxID=1917421 RepID=A0A2K9LGK4_9GAMM|nr:hypothetical protein [Ketobacter alkanivorans]AUM11516.1 hypothetical protein Kalk_03375 [Ketobacter alkanivorans]